jgi:hypothetical protein
MNDSPALRRWVVGAFVVLLSVLAVTTTARYLKKTQTPDRNGNYTRTAILRWRDQIHDLHAGKDPYRLHNYPNPPIMALILTPFEMLPPSAGSLAWLFAKMAMAGAMAFWAFRFTAEPGTRYPLYGAVAACLLSLHPILGDLSHGNVNIFIGFLLFAALECFRRSWDCATGLLIGLAVACKITPMLFIPYFGWKMVWSAWTAWGGKRSVPGGAWNGGGKVVAAIVLGLGMWLAVVPGAVLGFQRNFELTESWFMTMAKPFLVDGIVTSEHANQSIPGIVYRFFTNNPSTIEWDEDNQPVPSEYHTIVDLGPMAAKRIVQGCQLVWVLGVVLLCRGAVAGPSGRRQGLALAAECAFVMLGMLLFSERTWKHHATTLILPFAVIVSAIVRGYARGLLIGISAAAVVLMFGPGAFPEKWQDEALAHGTHTLAFLLLTAGTVVVLLNGRSAPGEPIPPLPG